MITPGTKIDTKVGLLTIESLLGKGKSGYSFLASNQNKKYVYKAIHYEYCPYYNFGNSNKVDIEVYSYQVLINSGIPIPELFDCSRDKNYLVKEYIEGNTASYCIANNLKIDFAIEKLFNLFTKAKSCGINLDYFPSNFIISNSNLYYVDYEHNPYDSKWDLINWGIFYWANAEGIKNYLKYDDLKYINESSNSGIPIKLPFYNQVNQWKNQFIQVHND